MANFGFQTSWSAIPTLGLDEFEHTFEPSETRRTAKIYAVPETVSANRYFISETEMGEVEEVPPSLVRETILLAHFIFSPSGSPLLIHAHPAVQAA